MAGLTHERFEALAEAYGGDVSRWPVEVLDAAGLTIGAEPAYARAVLERAGRLDAALDAWRPAPARASLTDRILAAAPAAVRRWPKWLSPAALGAGLAAACAAGVIAGVQVSMHSSDAQEVAVTNTLSAISSGDDLGEGA